MRIFILMRSSIWTSRGGAEVQAEFIRQAFVEAGHEVHFAFDARKDVQVEDDSTTYHQLPDRGRSRSYLNLFPIAKLIREVKPDVVYQRVRFSYTGIAAYLARRHGAKFIHGISADYACTRNRVPLNGSLISNAATEWLGRYGLRHADLVIAQTHSQAQMLKESFGIHSIVVPNGHPVPLGPFEKKDPPIVAWVANVKPCKRPEHFIELASRLRHTNARFVMAGQPADGQYQQKITRLLNGAPNVEYVGQLSLDEVNRLLERASLFVNTSKPREGFPNTFIQAWLRKTPVVTMDFDPDGLIAKQRLGMVGGNVETMADATSELLSSRGSLDAMGERSRSYAVNNYDVSVIGRRYVELTENLAKQRKTTQ